MGFGEELILHLGREIRTRLGHPTQPERGMRRDAELRPDGDAGSHDCPHRVGKRGRAIELDHVRPCLLDDADCGTNGRLDAGLKRAVGKVAAHQRARDAAADGLAGEDHLVQRDLELRLLAPHVHADGIADGDNVDARPVHDLRHRVVVRDDANDLPSIALHLLKRGDRHLLGGLHLQYKARVNFQRTCLAAFGSIMVCYLPKTKGRRGAGEKTFCIQERTAVVSRCRPGHRPGRAIDRRPADASPL